MWEIWPNVALQPTCGARLRSGGELRRRRMRLNFGVRRSQPCPGFPPGPPGSFTFIFALLPTCIIFGMFAAAASNGQPEFTMISVKEEVATLLESLPDDCSVEDIQYHLYVLEKVRRGLERADTEGSISQEDAETRLSKWLVE
jgi:hypothetical protein